MIKKIKEIVTGATKPTKDTDATTPDEDQRVIMVDPTMLLGNMPPEPDLRIIGLFGDVQEEKIAELIHGLLMLSEMNKLSEEDKQKPIEFFISTYGGNADDMFGLYDIIRQIKETSEIHTIGLGKVMSAIITALFLAVDWQELPCHDPLCYGRQPWFSTQYDERAGSHRAIAGHVL